MQNTTPHHRIGQPSATGGRSHRRPLSSFVSASADAHARFERDVVPLRGSLYLRALAVTQNREEAEDLVQDTLVNAYIAFASFRNGTHLKAWLSRILINTYINSYRKRRREPQHCAAADLTDEQLSVISHRTAGLRSAEDQALESLPDNEIKAAMLALPEQFRLAVYYADVEGLRCREVAEMMQTPTGTVGSRLLRARRRLRTQLAASADGKIR